MKKLSNKGFTLVELIIVIAILAIIMLIAIPNFSGIQQRMQVRADKSTAAQIGKAVRIWYTEFDSDPSFKAAVNGATTIDSATLPKDSDGTALADAAVKTSLPVADSAGVTMAHLCEIPQLISYVDTTLVPTSLLDANDVREKAQYYFVGMTGASTSAKIVVAIDKAAPTLKAGEVVDQGDVLYDGVATTDITHKIAYMEP